MKFYLQVAIWILIQNWLLYPYSDISHKLKRFHLLNNFIKPRRMKCISDDSNKLLNRHQISDGQYVEILSHLKSKEICSYTPLKMIRVFSNHHRFKMPLQDHSACTTGQVLPKVPSSTYVLTITPENLANEIYSQSPCLAISSVPLLVYVA